VQAARRVLCRAQKDIHPELKSAKVIVNGEEVAQITGTQEEYHVDVWSGNHPFYLGNSSGLVLDEGQVRLQSMSRAFETTLALLDI
jgi:large subunit ribosomal protein L31